MSTTKNQVPSVALLGRPNVGKSTLFNAVLRQREAIEIDVPGTTIDRLAHEVYVGNFVFTLIDMGGFVRPGKVDDQIAKNLFKQLEQGIVEADLVLFIVDGKTDLSASDMETAEYLRRSGKEVILVVNKMDGKQFGGEEFYSLGFPDLLLASAIHKSGINDLLEMVVKKLRKQGYRVPKKLKKQQNPIKIAFLGHPNAGKSSFVNAALGQERLVVSETPGTTRDTITVAFDYQETSFQLIDTAGIRQPGRLDRGIEKFSVLRAKDALSACDVAVLLVDATVGVTHLDKVIAGMMVTEGKGIIVAVSKWDLATEKTTAEQYIKYLGSHLQFLNYAPVVFTSALQKRNINKVFDLAIQIQAERQKKIKTPKINQFLQRVILGHRPSGTKTTLPKAYYLTQTGTEPPTFTIFVNNPRAFHFSYKRYLENKLRDEYGFFGTPIRLVWRGKEKRERIKKRRIRRPSKEV